MIFFYGFFEEVSVGWCENWVCQFATKSLPTHVDNPTTTN